MSPCHTFVADLRLLGYRITPQRERVIQALAHSAGHVTAEEVYRQVNAGAQAVNLATIYRTLDTLVAAGLASRANLQDGQSVYTTRQHGAHLHLVCRHCGSIIEADHQMVAPLLVNLQQEYAFDPDLRHVSISGVCAQCLSKIPKEV